MSRNVILTTIGNPLALPDIKYYSGMENKHPVYCHSVVPGEACTKFILSQYDIDEIVTIGSNIDFKQGDELRTMSLKEGIEFIQADQESNSAYSIFRYRISQFIDGLDFTTSELSELIPDEEKDVLSKAILSSYKKIYSGDDDTCKLRKLFIDISTNNEHWQMLLDSIKEYLNKDVLNYKEVAVIKAMVYDRLSEKNVMESYEYNKNTKISFIPIESTSETGSLSSIWKIIHKLYGDDRDSNENINLYIGIHSDNATDSFTLMSILSMLNNNEDSFTVKKVYSTHPNVNGWGQHISDDSATYSVMSLTSGLASFRAYGKVGGLINYLEEINFKKDKLTSLIYAMRNIDSGICLSDISELIKGINRLKHVYNRLDESNNELDEQQNSVINLIKKSILDDYGSLITDDNIDILELIKWAYNKKLYQQTLTIIESKIPDDMVDCGMYFYCNSPDTKADVVKAFNEVLQTLKRHETYQMKDLSHYFIKFYCRNINKSARDQKVTQLNFANLKVNEIVDDVVAFNEHNRVAAHTYCDDRELLKNTLFAYYNVGIVRNMTNHGDSAPQGELDFFKNENDDIELMQLVTDAIELFIKYYEQAKENTVRNAADYTKGDVGGVCEISYGEVRNASGNGNNRDNDRNKNNRNDISTEQNPTDVKKKLID